MRYLALVLWLALPGAGALADTGPTVARAQEAIHQIELATEGLTEAASARDRVAALTRSVQAFEKALAALRSGVRQIAPQERALAEALQARDVQTAELLAALQTTAAAPAPILLMHPAGPAGSVRASMLMAEVVSQLDAEAAALRQDMQDLLALAELRRAAEAQLEAGLAQVRSARLALTTAIAARKPLPKRFTADPVREAILIASADTLGAFTASLDRIATDVGQVPAGSLPARAGAIPLPVTGRIVRTAGEVAPGGVERPGVLVATVPHAVVTSPVEATMRYAGPLLDLGNVVILEPQADVLFVFAGLETLYGTAGDLIRAGTPIGLMGDSGDQITMPRSTDGEEAGASWTETLYIEVRQNNLPEDPGLWFQTEQDG